MVVQIEEFNATGRSEKGKIKGKDKFNNTSPGKLTLTIRYVKGVLEVDVHSAHQIFGKRSQDPYALVYLLDKEKHGEKHAKTWFQENNMKTKTVDKTLDPVWEHSFRFVGVNDRDLVRKSLVIAIWDDDSTSRDDYLAGVRIPMDEVLFFDANKGRVTMELQAQLADGHPGEIDQATWRFLFGYIERGWDLKTCNNHLVTFIEKARVLAEAYEVDNMWPRNLTNKTSMTIATTTRFDEELHQLQLKIQESKRRLHEREQERKRLRDINESIKADFDRRNKELQVHCSTGCGLQFTVGNLWSTGHRQHDVDIKHAGASTIRSSRDSTYIDRVIKIRTHYEAKMKLKLSEVRQSYSLKYQEFINEVHRHADEIMTLYEQIVRDRAEKSPDYRNGLLALEADRNYQVRIATLRSDIDALRPAIKAREDNLAGLESFWLPQIRDVEAMMDARKVDMRKLLLELRQYAESRYTVTNEVAIYDKLLTFEESRLSSHSQRRLSHVSVRSSTARHESHHEAHGGGMRRHRSSGYSSHDFE